VLYNYCIINIYTSVKKKILHIHKDTLKKNTRGHPLQLKNKEGEQEKKKQEQ
jgi:hypothetical protein